MSYHNGDDDENGSSDDDDDDIDNDGDDDNDVNSIHSPPIVNPLLLCCLESLFASPNLNLTTSSNFKLTSFPHQVYDLPFSSPAKKMQCTRRFALHFSQYSM